MFRPRLPVKLINIIGAKAAPCGISVIIFSTCKVFTSIPYPFLNRKESPSFIRKVFLCLCREAHDLPSPKPRSDIMFSACAVCVALVRATI